MLSDNGTIHSIVSPDGAHRHFSQSCNATTYRSDHIVRAKLVFAVAENAQEMTEVSQSLDRTLTVCKDLIHSGYYHPDNIVVNFVADSENLTVSDLIFDGTRSRRHRRVIGFQPHRHGLVRMTRYNIYQAKVVSQLVNLEETSKDSSSKQWLQDFPMEVSD